MGGTFTSLPVARWARDVGPGTVRVSGVLRERLQEGPLVADAGPIVVELVFHGGTPARLRWVRISGPVELGGRSLDGQQIDDESDMDVIIGMVSRLSDPDVEARAQPARALDLRLAEGLHLALEPSVVVTVSAAAEGVAGALRLTRPLVVGFGGDGVRVSHLGHRRLSRLASARLHRFSLAPDGRVRFEGAGARPLNVAVRGGFSTASVKVTRLVRRGERFRSLRAFLRLPDDPPFED